MKLNLINGITQNHSTPEPWHSVFITGYTFLFLLAMPCNLIVIVAGYRRYKKCKIDQCSRRRTELTRCILVIYLAILDILLCLTIPLTAISTLTVHWPLTHPSTDWMCRYTKFVPAMVIYATSMVVILIAVDSYRNICQPLKAQLTPTRSGYAFISIIVFATLLASPIFFASQMVFIPIMPSSDNAIPDERTTPVETNSTAQIQPDFLAHPIQLDYLSHPTQNSEFPTRSVSELQSEVVDGLEQKNMGIDERMSTHIPDISLCVENWEFPFISGHLLGDKSGRLYYSIFSLIVQYLLPFLTISILHAMVFSELKLQGRRRSEIIIQIDHAENGHTENARMKRNTAVLATMSLVFCFCWLPQNLIYAALDGYHDLFGYDQNTTAKISVICHWIGMASTCINPIIYGFLNTTIRTGTARNVFFFFHKLEINNTINTFSCSL